MSTVQKWLVILAGLGAGYLVVSNPQGVAKAASALQSLTAGSVTQIVTGGKAGG